MLRRKSPGREPALVTRTQPRGMPSWFSDMDAMTSWRQTASDWHAIQALTTAVAQEPEATRPHVASVALTLLAGAGRPPDNTVSSEYVDTWIDHRLLDASGSQYPEAAGVTARMAFGLPLKLENDNRHRREFTWHQQQTINRCADDGSATRPQIDEVLHSDFGDVLVPWMVRHHADRTRAQWHDTITVSRSCDKIATLLLGNPAPEALALIPLPTIANWLDVGFSRRNVERGTEWLDRTGIPVPQIVRDRLRAPNGLCQVARDTCKHIDRTRTTYERAPGAPAAAAAALQVLTVLPKEVRLALIDSAKAGPYRSPYRLSDLDDFAYPEERGNYAPVFAAITHDLPHLRAQALSELLAQHPSEITEPWFLQVLAHLSPAVEGP
jgi:hypothetical protein